MKKRTESRLSKSMPNCIHSNFNPDYKLCLEYNFLAAIEERGTSFEPDSPYPVSPITLDFRTTLQWNNYFDYGWNPFEIPPCFDALYHIHDNTKDRNITRREWKKAWQSYRCYFNQSYTNPGFRNPNDKPKKPTRDHTNPNTKPSAAFGFLFL